MSSNSDKRSFPAGASETSPLLVGLFGISIPVSLVAAAAVTGSVVVEDGVITAIDSGPSQAPGAIDLAGDFLLPGLVELHTDNLEKHFIPRPGTKWPALAAIVAQADLIRRELGWRPQRDDLAVIVKQALDWERRLHNRQN